eukprot:5562198-Ditylum_brightwellii.AAC.1
MTGRPLDPAPFVCLYNTASDLVKDIGVCAQLASLGQNFAEHSSLYIVPTAAPDSHPAKCLKVGPPETKDSENQQMKNQTQREDW